ncbi:C-X-C motif chemokine 10-like [Cololabis saira]|uniref:C-X-C motif chemokine 10-like n=1 Tax=Cololabis saira TaxID=129043 RepID=UPI002AD536E2|nr:C-X-C motif chemokine 10-like [Cololabis saira]
MSSMIRLFLLLAAVVFISEALLNEAGQRCFCQNVKNGFMSKDRIKDIQIYPATVFCDRVEIVVSETSGLRYCLNPKPKAVKKIVSGIISRRKRQTLRSKRASSATAAV